MDAKHLNKHHAAVIDALTEAVHHLTEEISRVENKNRQLSIGLSRKHGQVMLHGEQIQEYRENSDSESEALLRANKIVRNTASALKASSAAVDVYVVKLKKANRERNVFEQKYKDLVTHNGGKTRE